MIRGVPPGMKDARTSVMRDIRLFIVGHLMLIAVAVLGSI